VTVLIVTHDPAVSSKVRRIIAIRDGRTSTETLPHDGSDGSALEHAIEYAVLDRAGRLQLPRDMTETLGMGDRVRLELESDHIGVWPDWRASGAADPAPLVLPRLTPDDDQAVTSRRVNVTAVAAVAAIK
jgi:hypothetical protein